MQTINLNKPTTPRRRSGFTGYLDDFGVTIRIWWWRLRNLPPLNPWLFTGIIVMLFTAIVVLVQQPAQVSTVQVASAPLVLVATPTPAQVVERQVANGLQLTQAVIAYDAPSGTALDALEPGRSYTVLARSGAEWTQIRLDTGGDVWVRSEKLPGGNAPDIATPQPTLAPEREYVYVSNPAPAAPQPVEQAVAPAAPQPTAVLVVDSVAADACAGQETKSEGGINWICAVGQNDGQVYWLPTR